MTVSNVTKIFTDMVNSGSDRKAELFEALNQELRTIAGSYLRRERANHTLQATALVNEAWIKLVDQNAVPEGERVHFLSIASQAMRRILVDHAKGKLRNKRGGDVEHILLDTSVLSMPEGKEQVDLEALDRQLKELSERSERQAKIIEMRFFGGLTSQEVAQAIGVSLSTVDREWKFARVWLLSRLAS